LNITYNLPTDYRDLTQDGKRLARIACVSDQSTPERAVAAWDFFTRYYLSRDPGDMRLPEGFFYQGEKWSTPAIHHDMIRWAFQYNKNLVAIPRGFGKSIVIGETLPLFLSYTNPSCKSLLIFSTETTAEERMDRLIFQIANNPILIADFGVKKPKRGEAGWNRSTINFALNSDGSKGSQIRSISVGGKALGWRGRLIVADDIERNPHDASSGIKDMSRVREQIEAMIFGTLRPALAGRKCVLYLIGTMLSESSFISRAYMSNDERYRFWNRVKRAAIEQDGSTKRYLWFDGFNEGKLEGLRQEMGDTEFKTQYLNQPGSSHDAILKLDPTYHEYYANGTHPSMSPNPLTCKSEVRWNIVVREHDGSERPEQMKCDADRHINNMFRMITVDVAHTTRSDSDFSCIIVHGFDRHNVQWILDMYMKRVTNNLLLMKMWELAMKWRVQVCGIESVSIQKQFVERAKGDLMEISKKFNHVPRVTGIKYPARMSKADRIASLEWRLLQHRLKLPGDLKDHGPWPQLWAQISGFTMDMRNLPFDDGIDTLAMAQFVDGRRSVPQQGVDVRPTPVDRIVSGEVYDKATGLPWLHSADLENVDITMLDQLKEARRGMEDGNEPNWHPVG